MGVTIEDVARRAGVSPSTVSRALNRKGRISEETRQRVFEAARELEYPVPDGQACHGGGPTVSGYSSTGVFVRSSQTHSTAWSWSGSRKVSAG
jgi:transcriptional regulator with XRE-family HTH domain